VWTGVNSVWEQRKNSKPEKRLKMPHAQRPTHQVHALLGVLFF